MKASPLLLLGLLLSVSVWAETYTVDSITLFTQDDVGPVDMNAARQSPNDWKLPSCITCGDVAEIQRQFIRLGYNPGIVDGIIGPITRAQSRPTRGIRV